MKKTYKYSIKLDDETKAKATRIVNKSIEKFGLGYGRDKYHGEVWKMIEEEFPELSHSVVSCHPDMFTVYLLTGSDFQHYTSWKQVYDEYNVECGDRFFKVQVIGSKTTCICGQNTLEHSFIIQSKKTGVQLELGSSCIDKHFIDHLDKPNKKIQKKRLNEQKEKSKHFKKYRDEPAYKEAEDRKTAEEERKKAEEQERKEQRRKMMEASNARHEKQRYFEKRSFDEMMESNKKKQEEERQERQERQKQRDEEELRRVKLRFKEEQDRKNRQLEAKRQRMEREEMDAEAKRQRKIDKYNNRTPIQIWQDLRHQYYLDNIDPLAGYVPERKLYDEFEDKFPAPK